jgi:hypothetical protein
VGHGQAEIQKQSDSHLASVRHTTVSVANSTDRPEKVRMVEETFEPGTSPNDRLTPTSLQQAIERSGAAAGSRGRHRRNIFFRTLLLIDFMCVGKPGGPLRAWSKGFYQKPASR